MGQPVKLGDIIYDILVETYNAHIKNLKVTQIEDFYFNTLREPLLFGANNKLDIERICKTILDYPKPHSVARLRYLGRLIMDDFEKGYFGKRLEDSF